MKVIIFVVKLRLDVETKSFQKTCEKLNSLSLSISIHIFSRKIDIELNKNQKSFKEYENKLKLQLLG